MIGHCAANQMLPLNAGDRRVAISCKDKFCCPSRTLKLASLLKNDCLNLMINQFASNWKWLEHRAGPSVLWSTIGKTNKIGTHYWTGKWQTSRENSTGWCILCSKKYLRRFKRVERSWGQNSTGTSYLCLHVAPAPPAELAFGLIWKARQKEEDENCCFTIARMKRNRHTEMTQSPWETDILKTNYACHFL